MKFEEKNFEAHLDEVALRQFIFKNDVMRAMALVIVRHALERGTFWPDEIIFDFVGEKDRNCIGSLFRILGVGKVKADSGEGSGLGIISRTGVANYRRSKLSGGVIWEYRLARPSLAKLILRKFDVKQAIDRAHPILPGLFE